MMAETSRVLISVEHAPSKLLELRFVDSESTFDDFESTKAYLRRYGRPVAVFMGHHLPACPREGDLLLAVYPE